MFRRYICLLLVSLILANQGLCFAHAHHGGGFAEPEDHGTRPHVHLNNHSHSESEQIAERPEEHSHHEHSAGAGTTGEHQLPGHSEVAPVGEHDADAVYFAESVPLPRAGRSLSKHDAKDVVVATIFQECSAYGALHGGPASTQRPLSLDAGCPIYLRTLSLRL